MNITRIIPDGSQLGNVTRYYLLIISLLLFDTCIRAESLSEFGDIISLNSPLYALSTTLVVIFWRLVYNRQITKSFVLYTIVISIPVLSFLISMSVFQIELGIRTAGQLLFFSTLTYCFSYLEYYKQQAMTPIRNELLLASLQQKLKPHFLFNSINTVLGVIRDEPRLAERLLEDLSELFRNLAVDDRETYTFGEDFDLTLRYIDIENTRMAGAINLVTDIDKNALSAQVPFLLLQPLVENCIHYGLVDKNTNGLLRISAKKTSNGILIVLENNLKSDISEARGAGTTLANLRKRLKFMYDVEAMLDTNVVKGMYRIQIRIPE